MLSLSCQPTPSSHTTSAFTSGQVNPRNLPWWMFHTVALVTGNLVVSCPTGLCDRILTNDATMSLTSTYSVADFLEYFSIERSRSLKAWRVRRSCTPRTLPPLKDNSL